MMTSMTRKLMATSAAGVLGMLLTAMPASAQNQMRGEGHGGMQANESVRGGVSELRGNANVRGSANVRGDAARGNMRRSDMQRGEMQRGEMRRGEMRRGDLRQGGERRVRAHGETRTHVRASGQNYVRTRNDVRARAHVTTNTRTGIRYDRRHAWNDNVNWRNDHWRYRDRSARVRVGVGYSEPYYSVGAYDNGYDDSGYAAYGYSEPYAYRAYSDRTYSEPYYSYAASPGCSCSSAPYAAWGADDGWRRDGISVGFTAL
jgi:hypothetical protein